MSEKEPTLYQDTMANRFERMGIRNKALRETVEKTGGITVRVTDPLAKYQVDLKIDETFVKGANKALFTAHQDLARPLTETENGIVEVEDIEGAELAENILFNIKQL